jgi:hypothetical protein
MIFTGQDIRTESFEYILEVLISAPPGQRQTVPWA